MAWVVVGTFDQEVLAQLAKNRLEEEGLEAMLSDEQTIAAASPLTQAVGGIKLLVPTEQRGAAEEILSEQTTHSLPRITEQSAIAAEPEIAQHLASPGVAEPFDESPSDLLAERAWRTMVFGFLAVPFALMYGFLALPFLPLQFYAMYLLWTLRSASPPVLPKNRWKIYLAWALCLPLWFLVFAPFVYGPSLLSDPDAPQWKTEHFAGFGDRSLDIELPGPPEHDFQNRDTILGPAKARFHGANYKGQSFFISIFTLPEKLTPENPAQALKTFLDETVARSFATLESTKPITQDTYPGLEFRLRYKPAQASHPLLSVGKLILVDNHILQLTTESTTDERDNPLTTRFFRSAKLR